MKKQWEKPEIKSIVIKSGPTPSFNENGSYNDAYGS